MGPQRMMLLFFLLFVCKSFQEGNFTTSEILGPVHSSPATVVPVLTLEHIRIERLVLSINTSTRPKIRTSRPSIVATTTTENSLPSSVQFRNPFEESAIPPHSASNPPTSNGAGSAFDGLPAQAGLPTYNNVSVDITTRVRNSSNTTYIGRGHPTHLDIVRESPGNSTSSPDDDSSSGNNVRKDVSELWIRHQREKCGEKRMWHPDIEDTPLPNSSKSKTLPKVGATALAASTLYLATLNPRKRKKQQNTQERDEPSLANVDAEYSSILQPESRPISQEQLIAEVKGVYAGLIMVEAKCIEADNAHKTLAAAEPQCKLTNEQWQSLIALHRTLLHEHHDFFLASQHPSASPSLRRLASRYAMPARMWRHGIHSFLELLRHHKADSLDHMLEFIYFAYSMMASLYETVPAFEETWVECLGDLGRYILAVDDDDIRDREIWTSVARHWYCKRSNAFTTTGRLYHHLAVLARPNALQQLYYFSKSLCAAVPFTSARESILTLFDPVVHREYKLPPLDAAFVNTHGFLFKNEEMDRFEQPLQEFLALLDNQIKRATRKFREQGYYIAITNSAAMLGFGSKDSVLMKAIHLSFEESIILQAEDALSNENLFNSARRMANATLEIVLRRADDPNVLPFVHSTLAFMYYISRFPYAMSLVQVDFPWESLAIFLNRVLESYDKSPSIIESDSFPIPEEPEVRPLSEDFGMRGCLWTENYWPDNWFSNKIDENDQYAELPLMTSQRKERILWLAARPSSAPKSVLKYDSAVQDPVSYGYTKPEFSISTKQDTSGWGSSMFASPTDARADPWASIEDSFESHPIWEAEEGTSSSPTNDTLLMDGINATLALQPDTAEEFIEVPHNMTEIVAEDESPFLMTASTETIESWLSEFIDLDIDLDESENIESFQVSKQDGGVSQRVGDVTYQLDESFSTNLIVLCHARNDDLDEKSHALVAEEEGTKGELTEGKANGSENPSKPNCSQTVAAAKIADASDSPPHPRSRYTCPHCQKEFSRLSDLNKHVKYHTKPFQCQVTGCNYTCGRPQDLKRHQHGAHKEIFGIEEYPCPHGECQREGLKYSRRDNLLRHLRKRHGGDGEEDSGLP